MMKFSSTCGAIIIAVMAESLGATGEEHPDRSVGAMKFVSQPMRLPGTDFEIAIGSTVLDRTTWRVEPKLLTAITIWLSRNFNLPLVEDMPRIAFVPAKVIGELRYGSASDLPGAGEVVAVYNDDAQTIYLAKGWTGTTPAELSILVHEMVHHLQHVAGMRFACAEAREKLAYEAQQKWLALFGRDLFRDFDTDPFTLLVRTECLP